MVRGWLEHFFVKTGIKFHLRAKMYPPRGTARFPENETCDDSAVYRVSFIETRLRDAHSQTNMKLLTRSEEFVLLSVWRLQDEAYSLRIREQISEITGHEWSLGSIYTPLERLARRRLLTSRLSRETPERGGRKKRIYELTPLGKRALVDMQTVGAAMWDGVLSFIPQWRNV